MSATIDTWIGRLGLLAGVLIIAAWLATYGKPGPAPDPKASIRLGALANGELEISPVGKPVLASSGLLDNGRAETGSLRVRNQTPRALSFALRTTAVHRDLDNTAWIQVTDGKQKLLHTTLARSRAWTGTTLRLDSGESRTLQARVWLPEDAPDGWQAGQGDVTLEFASHPERSQ